MPEVPRTFVGFGFGAIQGGLFLYEAFQSGKFERLVVAEIVPEVVAALRRSQGLYRLNIATQTRIEVRQIQGVEIFNPAVPADLLALEKALADASEIATALPSVDFYRRGEPSVAGLIAGAMRAKAARPELPPCVVYTAENNNHAAELLQEQCDLALGASDRAAVRRSGQILNTVIGKMSGVIVEPEEIASDGLARLVDDFPRALLVEEFNRILITRIDLPGFKRGLDVFVEKPDLFPFEEAKLYGHNAVHALIGYLLQRRRRRFMSEAADDARLMAFAREAFLKESGPALIARHRGQDPLFTEEGYRAYADDLLSRMTNPYLRDRTERVTRDPRRKLAWEDRLIGTMRMALDAGVDPRRFAMGAAAALEALGPSGSADDQLRNLWPADDEPPGRKGRLIGLITAAQEILKSKEDGL